MKFVLLPPYGLELLHSSLGHFREGPSVRGLQALPHGFERVLLRAVHAVQVGTTAVQRQHGPHAAHRLLRKIPVLASKGAKPERALQDLLGSDPFRDRRRNERIAEVVAVGVHQLLHFVNREVLILDHLGDMRRGLVRVIPPRLAAHKGHVRKIGRADRTPAFADVRGNERAHQRTDLIRSGL